MESDYDPNDPHWNALRNIILPDAKQQPDRSLAIVYAAVIDDELKETLAAILVDDKKTQKKMLSGMGPLATFSAKIDLAFLIGVYPETMWQVLHGIREIRNIFAHQKEPMDLEDPKVLQIIDKLPLDRLRHEQQSGRDLYIAACEFLMGGLLAIRERSRLTWRPVGADGP